MVEMILKDLAKTKGLRFCTLRYFNVAGGYPKERSKTIKLENPILFQSFCAV